MLIVLPPNALVDTPSSFDTSLSVIFYIAPPSQAVLPEELVTLLDEEIDEQVARLAADGGDVN